MYFLAEYSQIILISTLTAIFFFGGFIIPEVIYNNTLYNYLNGEGTSGVGFNLISGQSVILALKTSVFCFAFV